MIDQIAEGDLMNQNILEEDATQTENLDQYLRERQLQQQAVREASLHDANQVRLLTPALKLQQDLRQFYLN